VVPEPACPASPYDLLVVGAGPVGCVIAERAASVLGWRSLVVDRANHVAGHCFDDTHDGVLVHRYGPHYFRTDREAIVAYLSRFTEWIDGRYVAKSWARGQLFPFPINLRTLEQFFGTPLGPDTARALIERVRDRTITRPANSEEAVLSRVGRELYETFYLGYTLKQWERHPRELDASVCGRIPVRFDYDERYADARFQVMPRHGFTRMFQAMLAHPLIELRLRTEYAEVRGRIHPRRATVYTGALDEYFDHCLGPLAWRSLAFEFRTFDQEYRQPCVQINYPNDVEYTRTVEFKHVTGQTIGHTVVSYEYPRRTGERYYPIPSPQTRDLHAKYRALAEQETRTRHVYFAGRLARYAYINMDEAVAMALETFETLRRL